MSYFNTTEANDTRSIFRAAAYLHAKAPEFSDKGMAIYYFIYPSSMSVMALVPEGSNFGSQKWLDQTWLPHMASISNLPGISNETTVSFSWSHPHSTIGLMTSLSAALLLLFRRKSIAVNPLYPAPLTRFQRRHGPEEHQNTQSLGVGLGSGDSWLLDREAMTSDKLGAVLKESMPKLPRAELLGIIFGGSGVFKKNASETSVHPSWRRAYTEIVAIGSGKVDAITLRRFAPSMGAYVNEAAPSKDWKKNYWGESNYARLVSIKRK